MSKAKIGAGHASGMARKGLTELGAYLPAFNQAGTQTVEDMAIWPNQTQGEIAGLRGGPGSGPEQESVNRKMTLSELRGYADEKATQSKRGMDHGQSHDHGGNEV
jgi:hypothetical protein